MSSEKESLFQQIERAAFKTSIDPFARLICAVFLFFFSLGVIWLTYNALTNVLRLEVRASKCPDGEKCSAVYTAWALGSSLPGKHHLILTDLTESGPAGYVYNLAEDRGMDLMHDVYVTQHCPLVLHIPHKADIAYFTGVGNNNGNTIGLIKDFRNPYRLPAHVFRLTELHSEGPGCLFRVDSEGGVTFLLERADALINMSDYRRRPIVVRLEHINVRLITAKASLSRGAL